MDADRREDFRLNHLAEVGLRSAHRLQDLSIAAPRM